MIKENTLSLLNHNSHVFAYNSFGVRKWIGQPQYSMGNEGANCDMMSFSNQLINISVIIINILILRT